jgi:hypothetical protein
MTTSAAMSKPIPSASMIVENTVTTIVLASSPCPGTCAYRHLILIHIAQRCS